MGRWFWLLGVALVLSVAKSPEAANTETVTVFGAASLTSALQDMVPAAAAQGLELRLSFGSSSTLAKQIERGAPADIYFSADTEWMDYLEKRGLVAPGTRVNLLGNRLVVIAPKGQGFRVEMRKGFNFAGAFPGRLALGEPSHVPAGIYAKQALMWLGWWSALKSRLAPAMDVRAALAYVERGECAAGVVYATDAAISPHVEVVATFPPQSHEPIVYPVAVMQGRRRPAVEKAMAFFRSPAARAVFRKYGFKVLKTARATRAPADSSRH